MEQNYLTLDERKQDRLTLKDYVNILWRRKLFFVVPFLVLLAGSGVVAKILPPLYESSAKIFVESPQIPDDVVRSSVTGYADDQIQATMQKRVLTQENLMAIIKKYDLYPDMMESAPVSGLIENMRSDIDVAMVDASPKRRRGGSGTIAFYITYQHKNPSIAQKVTDDLVALFLYENVKNRIARATATTKFLDRESERLKARVEVIDEQIAQYKQENKDKLPENLDRYIQIQERIKDELEESGREIKSLMEQKSHMEVQLLTLMAGTNENNREDQNSPESLLKKLKEEQLELSVQYQPSHPDLILLEQKIADLTNRLDPVSLGRVLEDERSQIENRIYNLSNKYTSSHPDIKVLKDRLEAVRKRLASRPLGSQQTDKLNNLNPAVQEARYKLSTIDSKMETLQLQAKELKEKINGLEQSILQVPQVERGIKALMRDYENVKMKYQDVKAKQMEAQLSQNLEAERNAERFSLLEPAIQPEKPVKPDRAKILLMGIFLSFAGGLGTVFIVESSDKRVRNPNVLTKLLKQVPLVVIPYIENEEDHRKKKQSAIAYSAAILLISVAGLAAIHFYYKPLDQLWHSLLNRLDFL